MAAQTVWESYPFIAPERYQGKLNGKVAIITGTSVGIGRAMAKAFAAAGASVACVARREADLNSLVKEIESAGGRAIAIVADVSARGAPREIVSKTESALGPIDILVNNAGISRIGPLDLEEEDLDIWWKVHEVNVRAPVALTRAVLPSMLKRKTGIIISISSGVVALPLPVMTAYASSKAAISRFHEALAYELKDTGVYTYALCPGRVETELGKPTDAFNKGGLEHPATKGFLASIGTHSKAAPADLPANAAVAIAADERFRLLTGRHLTAGENLELILLEAEKPDMGRLSGKDRLYYVSVGQL